MTMTRSVGLYATNHFAPSSYVVFAKTQELLNHRHQLINEKAFIIKTIE